MDALESKLSEKEIEDEFRSKGVTAEQIEFIEQVKANGGIAFIAWSLEDVTERLELKVRL